MVRWTHFSNNKVEAVTSVKQEGDLFKPRGFWISDEDRDDGWRSWCISEGFRLETLTHVHNVILSETADILLLSNASDIDMFSAEYKKDIGHRCRHWIDWALVAERYQGILITPYIWARRLDDRSPWYYSWDCASGCIWDATAISAIEFKGVCQPADLEDV